MDAKNSESLPQLFDLPFASDSEHEEIVYWYTNVSFPDARGEARSVRLHKERRLIEFDYWTAARFYTIASVKKMSERDMELAAAKGHEKLKWHEKLTEKQLDGHEELTEKGDEAGHEVSVTIALQGFPSGVKVVMKKMLYRHSQVVWADSKGRVW